MYLASLLIGSAAALWSLLTVAKTGDRRFLLITALPLLLILFDVAAGNAIAALSATAGTVLLLLHLLTLAIVAWLGRAAWSRSELEEKHADELAEARFESEAMRRLKTAFLANMNHEIRTPLTSIIGFSSLLMEEVADDHRNMIRVIERSGQRLLDTLDSILDLAMLEAGTVQLNNEYVELIEEASLHAERYAPLARRKGLGLEVKSNAESVRAYLDRACLSRILSRLISNAIKFTEEGSVTIEVRSDDGRAVMAVKDTGIGIDEAFFPDLFQEFSQESTGKRRAFEGSGLGLAVTKRLVELLNGDIHVETEPDRGSTFIISLPAEDPRTNGDGLRDGTADLVAEA